MIEEITSSFNFTLLVLIFVPIFIACLVIAIFLTTKSIPRLISFIPTICSIITLIGISIFINMETVEHEEQIRQQINSLPCEDLEEAYDIYGLNYIKEKYARECIGDYQWWK